MSAIDREPFPRKALIAAGALVGATLVLTAVSRLQEVSFRSDNPGWAEAALSVAGAETVRELTFADGPDGEVFVRDARGAEVAVLVAGEGGFLRGVLRGVARERRAHEVAVDAPLILASWPDGRLSLDDPSTGRRLELASFGPDPRALFAALLDDTPRAAPATNLETAS